MKGNLEWPDVIRAVVAGALTAAAVLGAIPLCGDPPAVVRGIVALADLAGL